MEITLLATGKTLRYSLSTIIESISSRQRFSRTLISTRCVEIWLRGNFCRFRLSHAMKWAKSQRKNSKVLFLNLLVWSVKMTNKQKISGGPIWLKSQSRLKQNKQMSANCLSKLFWSACLKWSVSKSCTRTQFCAFMKFLFLFQLVSFSKKLRLSLKNGRYLGLEKRMLK